MHVKDNAFPDTVAKACSGKSNDFAAFCFKTVEGRLRLYMLYDKSKHRECHNVLSFHVTSTANQGYIRCLEIFYQWLHGQNVLQTVNERRIPVFFFVPDKTFDQLSSFLISLVVIEYISTGSTAKREIFSAHVVND
jgi:hypothetical protein